MRFRTPVLVAAVGVSILGWSHSASAQRPRDERGRFMAEERAICVLEPVGRSGVSGVVHFTQIGDRVRVTGRITGLTPGRHGFHVHQFGDLSDNVKGESAGGHFTDALHKEHGPPHSTTRHVGDLGNVEANSRGVAIIDTHDSMIRLHGPESILGRSIIVHEKADTFGQPTGNAGGRVAYGVIGWANPKSMPR